MTGALPFLCFFLASTAACSANVSLPDVLAVFQEVIPTTDGSVLSAAAPGAAAELVLRNIQNNINTLGGELLCDAAAAACVLSFPEVSAAASPVLRPCLTPPPRWQPRALLRASMLAVLGNFANGDLELGDALVHIRIDPSSGLLRRAHTAWWLRLVLADALLVLAIVMLGRRAFDAPQ